MIRALPAWPRALALLPALLLVGAATTAPVTLRNAAGIATIDPTTLELRYGSEGRPLLPLSAPASPAFEIEDLRVSGDQMTWQLTGPRITATARLEAGSLSLRFTAEAPCSLTFPRITGTAADAWSLPIDEGVFVPADDAQWIRHLVESSPLDTTAGLGLPFLGLHTDGVTVSVLLPNPFHNAVRFQDADGRLSATLTHTFPPFPGARVHEVRFRIDDSSPITAALHYREWLKTRGEWVGLDEKIRRTPSVSRLPGAAHIYLWGDEPLAVGDVSDWKRVAFGLASPSAPTRHIRSLLSPEAQESIATATKVPRPDRYQRSQATDALNAILARPDLYHADAWSGVALDPAIQDLVIRSDTLDPAERFRLNAALLTNALPGCFPPIDPWGDGVSPRLVRELIAAGFDRLWLGSGSWDGFLRRPETVAVAREHGYLIGPYDSYHSIHSPSEPDTWQTAQFDAELYDQGAITDGDGEKRRGFRQKGHLLSPLAAQPWVERRVTPLMAAFGANSWFIDCDGFGQYFDDYSPAHRAIHFAHGVMTPSLSWGDAAMKDRQSPFFVGAYHPPEAPAIFFKPIPLQEKFHRHYFDPRFRLPLFQVVFHDSVVATHHWGSGSFKFRDETATTRLMELLYSVPPLWHLNREEFARRRTDLQSSYRQFSPLQRELALLPLTAFRWLTPDRRVQQTVFGDRIELTANFGPETHPNPAAPIPSRSLRVHWRDSGRTLFIPADISK